MMDSKKLVSIVFLLFFLLVGISYAKRVILSEVPDYDWWYGCAPTAAGMLIGYYDIHGYDGLRYDNLVPGGKAELSTFPSTEGVWEYKAQYAIASPEHVNDFYSGGYGASGDDAPPHHDFNCLADFMGTSQDSAGNSNGATTFYFYKNGSPLYVADICGTIYQNSSGLYGIWEYINYRGYGTHNPVDDRTMFNQYVDTYVSDGGFSFADFMSEIDSGRPVIIHLDGHSMLGYGYDTEGNIIYIHDTWNPGDHTMTWGGTYGGMGLIGVTCVHLTGGSPVPIPNSIMLISSGILLIFVRRKT